MLCCAQEFVETDAEKAAAAFGTGKAAPGKKLKKNKKGTGSSADEARVVGCVFV